jgi:hypothetical protein
MPYRIFLLIELSCDTSSIPNKQTNKLPGRVEPPSKRNLINFDLCSCVIVFYFVVANSVLFHWSHRFDFFADWSYYHQRSKFSLALLCKGPTQFALTRAGTVSLNPLFAECLLCFVVATVPVKFSFSLASELCCLLRVSLPESVVATQIFFTNGFSPPTPPHVCEPFWAKKSLGESTSPPHTHTQF